MKRTLLAALAAPLALLAVAATALTASAAAPYPPPTGEWPAEWPVLVDDTQSLAIAVPAAWSDVDTAPAQNDDGTPRPWISATTDEAAFFPDADGAETFAAPGVVYAALPYDDRTDQMVVSPDYAAQCVAGPVQAFAGNVFTGHLQTYTDCGGTATRIVQLAAYPADLSFTAFVLVQLTGSPDDDGTLNAVLSSLGRVAPPAG
jgi:hypothetical protein